MEKGNSSDTLVTPGRIASTRDEGEPGTADKHNVGETVESGTRLSWPHLYLGAIGFAISLYSIRVHNMVARGGDGGCGYSDVVNCSNVLGSEYAKIFGIPLGAFGMAFFIVVIMTGITTNPKTTERQAVLWRLLVMSAGICGSIALTYISLAIIKAACPICLATHTVVVLLFLVSLVQYLKARRAPQEPLP